MNLTVNFRRRLRQAVVLPSLILGLIALALFGLVAFLVLSIDQIDRSDRLMARAIGTARLLGDLDGQLRGFVAAGTPESLQAYRQESSRIEGSFDELDRIVVGDPERSRRVEEMRARWEQCVVLARAVVANRERPAGDQRGMKLALAEVEKGMAAIQDSLATFADDEQGIRDRSYRPGRSDLRSLLAVACGGAIVLGAILAFETRRRLVIVTRAFEAAIQVGTSQAELRERENLSLMSEVMKYYAIFSLDAEGRISNWNQAAERLLGYQEDEVLTRHLTCLYSGEDVRSDRPHRDLDWATREGRLEDERWIVRKDGFRFKARISLVAIRDPDGSLSGFTNVVREVEEKA